MNKQKLLERILASPANVRFHDMVILVQAFGFHLDRVNGSHHIFKHPEVRELVNLQEHNGKAKSYQVRQFLQVIERFNLRLGDEQ